MRAVLAGVLTLAFAAGLVANAAVRDGVAGAAGDASRARAGASTRRSPRRHCGVPAMAAGGDASRDGEGAGPSKTRRTGCLVTGHVVDPDGAPADGAEVRIVNAFGKVTETTVSAEGGFEAEITVTGAVRCVARAAGRVAVASAWANAAPGGAIDAGTLVLEKGERIVGRVRDPLGRGIKGVYVNCAPADDDALERWHGAARQEWSKSANCGDDGEFLLRGLPAGRYLLRMSPPGACTWWSDGIVVEAGDEELLLTMPAEYAPRRCSFEVRAKDEDGNDVSEFFASLGAWRQSDANRTEEGCVSVALTESPPFRLTVSADGFETVAIDGVEDRASPIVVCLAKARAAAERVGISGVVEFEGEPLAAESQIDLRLVAPGEAPDDGVTLDASTAEDGGEFVLTPRVSGAYRITAEGRVRRRDGAWAYVMGRADVASGDEGVRVRVLPKSSISGVVRLADDAEPDEVSVTVAESRAQGVVRTDSIDKDRRAFSVEGLPSDGVFKVGVSVRIGEEWMRGTVVAGVVTGGPPVEFRFEPGLAIEGVVVRADGSPVAGAQVWTGAERPHYRIAATGVDGRFRLTGLREGTERLRAWAPGLVLDGPTVTVSVGETGVRLVVVPESR